MNIIIAGGGTGGHLFPGIAVAEEFIRRDKNNNILFVGTERGLEKKILGKLGWRLLTLDLEGIKGRGISKVISAVLKVPRGILQSREIIREFKPDIVIGVGGYASGPMVMSACIMGVKTAIMEQNALPGLTNRILSKMVDRIFLTFPDAEKMFPERKVMVLGNPVRAAFIADSQKDVNNENKFKILIFGGSQGAHAINRLVTDALPYLKEIKERLKITHQTGEKELEVVSKRYNDEGFDAEVLPFISDMASAYRSSDLLICRAGATTIAEITACGKASILIPFPFAVNDHQTKNAEVMVNAKASIMQHEKDITGMDLAEIILHLYKNPKIIREMGENARRLGNVNAASDIVDACTKLI